MPFSEFAKRLAAVIVALLLVWGIWMTRGILLLGFAAALLAVAINIPARLLQRWGWKRGWAVAAAVLVGLLFLILLALLVLPRLIDQLVALITSIPAAMRTLVQLYERLRNASPFFQLAMPPISTGGAGARLTPERAQEILRQVLDASVAIAPRLLSQLGQVVNVLIDFVFMLFIAVFFLIDPRSYVQGSLYLIPRRYHQRAVAIWQELYESAVTWITTLAMSITVTVTLVLVILGGFLQMPNAVVVSVFAGLATFIPNIGAFLPLIPIVSFGLAADQPSRVLIYVPVYLLIQLFESNVITPSLVKSQMKIPAGAMMLFQLLATFMLGSLGLLLAVPMFAMVIVLVREIYSFELLGLRHTALAVHTTPEGQVTLVEVEPDSPTTADVPFVRKRQSEGGRE